MAFDHGMGSEFVEYLVQWFPHDGPDASKTFREQEAAERFYAKRDEEGEAPTMMERVVLPWSLVKSSALPGFTGL